MRIADIAEAVEREGRAVLVLVAETRGSAPREAGATMLVTPSGTAGTVGGGTVEHRAVERARRMLAGDAPDTPLPPHGDGVDRGVTLDFPLGPDLDQCCGGHMRLAFAVFGPGDLGALYEAPGAIALWEDGPVLSDRPRQRPVLIYGAGHVGRALAAALSPLPFAVRWIDARLDAFPSAIPPGVASSATPLPEAEAKAAPAGAFHIVLTHSHALDLEIVTALMDRGGFGFLGLIGSATKRTLFLRRLAERGIPEARCQRLVCPIGVPGVRDKRPAVIAAAVAAQLLLEDARAVSQELPATA